MEINMSTAIEKKAQTPMQRLSRFTLTEKTTLAQANDMIDVCEQLGSKCHFITAKVISHVKAKKLYAPTYKSLEEWAKITLGLGRSALFNYLNIAEKFAGELVNGNIKSVLALDNGDDFSVTQLQELTRVGEIDEIRDFIKQYSISPDMKVAGIRNLVNLYKERKNGNVIEGTAEEVTEDTTEEVIEDTTEEVTEDTTEEVETVKELSRAEIAKAIRKYLDTATVGQIVEITIDGKFAEHFKIK